MAARLLILLYAFVAYTAFFVSSNYEVGFIGNYWVPKSIDLGSAADPREAVIVDLLLLGAFAIQHSVMARPAFKHWWTKIIPPVIERSTYVLLSSLILLLLFWQWRPIPTRIWRVEGIAAHALTALYWLGWAIAIGSDLLIGYFSIFCL